MAHLVFIYQWYEWIAHHWGYWHCWLSSTEQSGHAKLNTVDTELLVRVVGVQNREPANCRRNPPARQEVLCARRHVPASNRCFDLVPF